MPQSKSKPTAPSRRDELFTLARDLLLTAVTAAGGAPANEQQARELVRLARAVQAEVDKPTARPAVDVAAPSAELSELTDTSF
jgi:hypothetical protein